MWLTIPFLIRGFESARDTLMPMREEATIAPDGPCRAAARAGV
jgi:hypothetical protein